MLRDNLLGLIEPMQISAGVDPLALTIQKQASDDRPSCLENPRPERAESSLTENVTSPFQAEPAQLQYVIFRAIRTDGIHIGQGRVIVFNGFDNIESRFVEFWSLLAKQNVEENSLRLAFQPADTAIFQYRRVSELLHRYKEKVSRNSLSSALEPLIGEYLGEIIDEASRDKLRDFFVKSQALGEALDAVKRRISIHLSETVRSSGDVVEPARQEDLRKGIRRKIDTSMSLPPKGHVLLLLGRVGSGKTTFMNHFMRVELKELFENHILAVFDFRLLEKGGNVANFFYQALHESLAKNQVFRNLTSKQLRKVYASDIHALTTGPLAYVEKNNKRLYEEKIAEFLMQKFMSFDTHYVKVLRYLATRENVRSVFVFDNADQHDFDLQQEVFRFAHSVAGKCLAMSIVPMWEETYLRSRQSGSLAAYPASAYVVPQTSVVSIINKRLEAIIKDLKEDTHLARRLVGNVVPTEDVVDFLNLIRDSIFYQGKRVRFFLESLAMGNLRRALELFASFLTSGHTDANKILINSRGSSGYLVPLHEVIKSIGLGDSRYYHGDLSSMLNLYAISDEARPSHFTKIRILVYLSHHRNHNSSFGLGFVRNDIIQDDFGRIGTSEVDISESLKILARNALVENDIYESDKLGGAFRVTLAGRYYLQFLATRFSYLDLVLQDTPIGDEKTVERIAALVDHRDLSSRFARVEAFLDYLKAEEDREHLGVVSTSESIPLRRRLITEMIPEYVEEKAYIMRMGNKRRRASAPEGTPYEILPDTVKDA